MKTLTRSLGWTRRSTALAVALLAVAGALLAVVPTPTAASFNPPPCRKTIGITTYYSDATKTTRVGTCINDQCAGTFTCTGTKTSFVSLSAHSCSCDI